MVYHGFHEFFTEWWIGLKRATDWFKIQDRPVKVRVRLKNGNYVKTTFGIQMCCQIHVHIYEERIYSGIIFATSFVQVSDTE